VDEKLKILLVTPELAPYAKAGGLADYADGLAAELLRQGHDVRIVLPRYRSLNSYTDGISPCLPSVCVSMGQGEEWCAVDSLTTERGVKVYLIRHDLYFDRPGIYHGLNMEDYYDNPKRFGFFCRAALQVCLDCAFEPDIVHANDWPTALAPAYLKTWFWNHPVLGKTASVLTIHNVAHQGVYPSDCYGYLGLGEQNFNADRFESYNKINFLKGGIFFSDCVNTVSPTHAKEITTPFGGFGLAPYLSNKGENFRGILNGVDYKSWAPDKDPCIPAQYTSRNLGGKAVCKEALQEEFRLTIDPHVCVIGAIGRLVHQKGYSLIREILERVLGAMHLQFVILGSGDPDLEYYFGGLPARWPGRAGSYIGYSVERSHQIESGADFFLMPSLFEPCGLNQLYSMRFGTPPIVRATGGLDDTVDNYNENTGEGTGFKFYEPSGIALYYAIGWAVSTYYDRPGHMRRLIVQAMSRRFTWYNAAREYERFYLQAIAAKPR
jgi:starch synthase